MDKQQDEDAQSPTNAVARHLEEIARATIPAPARLPDAAPANIPATTSDSNAHASLVLGIISLCLPIVCFPIALLGLIFGLIANAHVPNLARTGIILNSIALGIIVLAGILLLVCSL